MRGWPAARTRSARKRWFDTSSVSSPNNVGRNCVQKLACVRASASDDTHLVAEASIAATDAFLVAGAHGEAHDAVEAGGTGLSRRCTCGVGVVVKVGGRGATYVGVAADSVFPDCVGAVESEECQWYARGLLGALHLQDCTDDK